VVAGEGSLKTLLSKLGNTLVVVIHDPKVERAFWQFVVLIAVRVLIALGASAEVVNIVGKL
jgi:hypothetical protein